MKNKYYLSLVIKEDESEYDEKEDSFKNEEFDDLMKKWKNILCYKDI